MKYEYKKLAEINFDEILLKKGDIKVDSQELMLIFKMMHDFISLVRIDELDIEQAICYQKNLEVLEYLMNKYLVLSHVRDAQKEFYSIMKTEKLEDKTQNDVYEFYLDAKMGRENIQQRIDEKKRNLQQYIDNQCPQCSEAEFKLKHLMYD